MTHTSLSNEEFDGLHNARLLAFSKRFANDALESLWFDGTTILVGAQEERLTPSAILKGCLWECSEMLVDELYEDLLAMESAGSGPESWRSTSIVSELPPRFRHKYDVVFVRKFLLVSAELSRRVCVNWQPLSCVAMELALDVLLDKVEVALDMWDLDVDPDWRVLVEDALREDRDADALYGHALDGIEGDPGTADFGMADQRFDSWFGGFKDGPGLPPYCDAS